MWCMYFQGKMWGRRFLRIGNCLLQPTLCHIPERCNLGHPAFYETVLFVICNTGGIRDCVSSHAAVP